MAMLQGLMLVALNSDRRMFTVGRRCKLKPRSVGSHWPDLLALGRVRKRLEGMVGQTPAAAGMEDTLSNLGSTT